MKNNHIFIYALLMLSLAACSSSKFNGVNNVDDDVYWSSKDEPKSGGKNIKDVEPWNKNKGPNPSSYEPVEQNTSASSDQSYVNIEEERGRNAYQAWQNRTNAKMAEDTSKQNYAWVSNNDNERDARRFGSDRNYYYDDPYYNVLSNNWGWTSFYNPIVRPGFYNWAPGWNVGLSWNSYNGFGVNMGYNAGWGGMGYGFNPWYGPQYGGFYSPYYDPFYQPFYNPYYGYGGFYNPYGYPYGFYHPYAYGNRWGHCNNYNRYGRYYGRHDVVTNRPIIRPRNSMGSAVGGTTASRPRGAGVDDQRVYTNRPNTYVPERPEMRNTNSVRTNRPGGDLYYDEAGKPVYVSPNRRPSGSGSEPTNTYSNRPGGDLRPGTDGKPVYIPARPRGEEVNPAPSRPSSTPERSRRAENSTYEPSRAPVYSAPEPRGNSPRNSNDGGSRPSYSAPSAPAQRPSYSAPSNNRPSSSPTPSSRPSSSPGGNVRPR
jgi:hypothetical protein